MRTIVTLVRMGRRQVRPSSLCRRARGRRSALEADAVSAALRRLAEAGPDLVQDAGDDDCGAECEDRPQDVDAEGAVEEVGRNPANQAEDCVPGEVRLLEEERLHDQPTEDSHRDCDSDDHVCLLLVLACAPGPVTRDPCPFSIEPGGPAFTSSDVPSGRKVTCGGS